MTPPGPGRVKPPGTLTGLGVLFSGILCATIAGGMNHYLLRIMHVLPVAFVVFSRAEHSAGNTRQDFEGYFGESGQNSHDTSSAEMEDKGTSVPSRVGHSESNQVGFKPQITHRRYYVPQ